MVRSGALVVFSVIAVVALIAGGGVLAWALIGTQATDRSATVPTESIGPLPPSVAPVTLGPSEIFFLGDDLEGLLFTEAELNSVLGPVGPLETMADVETGEHDYPMPEPAECDFLLMEVPPDFAGYRHRRFDGGIQRVWQIVDPESATRIAEWIASIPDACARFSPEGGYSDDDWSFDAVVQRSGEGITVVAGRTADWAGERCTIYVVAANVVVTVALVPIPDAELKRLTALLEERVRDRMDALASRS